MFGKLLDNYLSQVVCVGGGVGATKFPENDSLVGIVSGKDFSTLVIFYLFTGCEW